MSPWSNGCKRNGQPEVQAHGKAARSFDTLEYIHIDNQIAQECISLPDAADGGEVARFASRVGVLEINAHSTGRLPGFVAQPDSDRPHPRRSHAMAGTGRRPAPPASRASWGRWFLPLRVKPCQAGPGTMRATSFITCANLQIHSANRLVATVILHIYDSWQRRVSCVDHPVSRTGGSPSFRATSRNSAARQVPVVALWPHCTGSHCSVRCTRRVQHSSKAHTRSGA